VTGTYLDAYRDAETLLGFALSGDHDAVDCRFQDVLESYGTYGAYRVALCLVATMVGDVFTLGGAALLYPGIDHAPYDERWVARFASAYANADKPTGEALFGAAIADGQLRNCMMALTTSTLATLRLRAA
jgi:hypothetical protein